ncbi:hypothetical protein MTO96_028721 [Rhipicephalus appendiculatus]
MWLKPFCYLVQVLAHGLSGSTSLQLPKPKAIDQPYLPDFATCTWSLTTSPMSRHCWIDASPSLFWDAPLVAPLLFHVTSTHRLKRHQLQTYAFCGHGGPSTNMWLKPLCYLVQVLAHGLSGSTSLQLPKPKAIDQPYLPDFATCTWSPTTSPMSRHSWIDASPSLFWDAPLVAPLLFHVTSTHRLKRHQLQTYAFCGHGGPSTNMWLKPWQIHFAPRMCPLPHRAFGVPTELVVIVVVALIPHAQGQIYCLKEYKISPNHTGCKNANNITTVPAYGLQSFYKDVLLQLFNSYRSSVAVGNCKPFPSAANMLKLDWDNELATLAYLHSAFLINASNWPLHDEVENRFTTRFKETGQSVAVLHNTTHRYVSYWNTVIREWFAEYQLMKLAAVGSYDADESTTNVSQMWWATTKYVGCGYSTMLMPNGHDFDHAYVCNFGPAGNVRGHAIYRQGATCGACPKETRCEPTTGLCSVVDEPPVPSVQRGRDSAAAATCGSSHLWEPPTR